MNSRWRWGTGTSTQAQHVESAVLSCHSMLPRPPGTQRLRAWAAVQTDAADSLCQRRRSSTPCTKTTHAQDRILRERLPCALVFENDVLLAPGFVRRLGHLALPEALDVLKLETCNLAAPFRMTRLQVPLHYRYIAVTLPLHYRSG